MPWTIKDVDRHKSGLTDRQKRIWVRVANSALRSCLARNGTQSTCEGSAIRQANATAGRVSPVAEQAVPRLPCTILAHVGFEIRYEVLENREYLVAPIVPIVEGVLNEYFVPREEIAAVVEAWNHVPVPIGHPKNDYGDFVSARTPAVLEQSVGFFFNARVDGARLLGEIWLDLEKCQRLGGDAAECVRRIEAGESMECSTAFYPDTTMQQGVFNQTPYIGVHRHLRPDHLALLPNGIGACSVEMGCGVRIHQAGCACQGAATMEHGKQSRFKAAIHSILAFASGSGEWSGDEQGADLATHLTHDDLRMSLADALAHKQQGTSPWPGMVISDVEDGFVIYRQGYGDGACCYRHAYTVDEGTGAVMLTGEPEEVQRNTQYVPVVGNAAHPPGGQSSRPAQEETMLKKADVVHALIAHDKTIWNEHDRSLLMALGEEQLARLTAEADTRPLVTVAQLVTPETPAAGVVVPAAQESPVTLEAIQALLKTELDARDVALETRMTTLSQQATERAERTQLVAHLCANGFTEDDCQGMTIDALRKTVRSVAPATFAGMGLPAFPHLGQGDEDLPSDSPTWQ